MFGFLSSCHRSNTCDWPNVRLRMKLPKQIADTTRRKQVLYMLCQSMIYPSNNHCCMVPPSKFIRTKCSSTGKDYKPMHYDRGSDEEGVPQLTIGASFGATRELTLMHVKSGVTMSHGCRRYKKNRYTE